MTRAREPVVVLGASGHAKVIIDILQDNATFDIAGTVSKDSDGILGLAVLGDDEALPRILASGVRHAFVAVGNNRVRAGLVRHVLALGFQVINAVSRHAVVSARARLGVCVAVMPGAVINVDSVVGDGAIINTGASVDHDCHIGACAHVGPGSHLAGNVIVGDGAFLGVGTSVIPGRTIGAWSTIGAGAVIVRDVPAGVTAVGVPARVLKTMDVSS